MAPHPQQNLQACLLWPYKHQPMIRRAGGHSRPGRPASVGSLSDCPDQGAHAMARVGCPRGLLVGRRRAGFGAGSPVATLAGLGARVPVPTRLWGASRGPHPLCPEESQAAASLGDASHDVGPSRAHAAATSGESRGVAGLGSPTGTCLAAHLRCCRRPSWLSRTNASYPAGLTAKAAQGLDRAA